MRDPDMGRIKRQFSPKSWFGTLWPSYARGRVRPRHMINDPALLAGAVLVSGLFVLVLFGPIWAPVNPYIAAQHLVPHYDVQSGQYVNPPLPPSSEYPLGTDRWGNDLLSMLMHGARNTLVSCALITVVRICLGLILGGVAGWNEGKASDQLIMAAIGVVTSVPALISSILLIYALDIRRGLPVFIVALSLSGWTEIAQYIRGEFLVLRKMPYIEGARAVGMNELAVAVRHVLPNIVPQLLVISCLEMGAVMMLLGELGFVGVYIGGGSRMTVEIDPFTVEFRTLVEVPEWGAMLADGFRWLRSRPFVVLPPAVAFFVSVLGFNTLGDGLRRLVEQESVSTAFLLRKRMLLIVPGLVLVTVLIINNTGPAPWFAKVAEAFSGELAYDHVQALSSMAGRGVGQEGSAQAAAYIESKFREYGLEPGWKRLSYIYPVRTRVVRATVQPYLALLGEDGNAVQAFRHQLDFGFMVEGHGGSGDVRAPVTFVGFQSGPGAYTWESFKGLDLRGQIVLLAEGNAPPDFATEALIRGAEGVLWVAAQGRDDVRSQIQVLDRGQGALRMPQIPIFRIRPDVAKALLHTDGDPVSELLSLDSISGPVSSGWFTRSLDVRAQLSLALAEPQEIDVSCVLGYMPGTDYDLAGQLVVLYASYDGLGIDPDGTIFAGANHNASGIGVLLELARLWQEQQLDARRSVLFVAWGAGQLEDSGAGVFLGQDSNFRHLPALTLNKPALIFELDSVGAGGDTLVAYLLSGSELGDLVESAAAEVGVEMVWGQDAPSPPTRRVPGVYLAWRDSQIAPDQDRLEHIEPAKLQAVGELLSLALTRVVRQARY
jgi:peptide/nickel transport system permease protein